MFLALQLLMLRLIGQVMGYHYQRISQLVKKVAITVVGQVTSQWQIYSLSKNIDYQNNYLNCKGVITHVNLILYHDHTNLLFEFFN